MSRRRILAAGLGIATILLGAGIYWFQPHKLFVDETVDEAAPTLSAAPSERAAPQQTAAATPAVRRGMFEDLEHETKGTAVLQPAGDAHLVRFEDFTTSNGPDLRVYLSKKPAGLGWRDYGTDFIELGRLKGNIGDQNYEVPAGTDVDAYRSVVIWCKRFSVGFGVAEFTA